MDLAECRTEPIDEPQKAAAVRVLRRTDTFRFVPLRGTPAPGRVLADPTAIFEVTFNRRLPLIVKERVTLLFAREWRAAQRDERVDEPGFIYCFHDLADPANVLKIGRTSRRPEQRRAEWERELAPGTGKSVRLLFAYAADCNEFAESVVHEVLRCEHIANRINPLTRKELTEFFSISNVMAASIFVRETLRYVNRFCRRATERFGTRPRAPELTLPPRLR